MQNHFYARFILSAAALWLTLTPTAWAGFILDSVSVSYDNGDVYEATFDDTQYMEGVQIVDASTVLSQQYFSFDSGGFLAIIGDATFYDLVFDIGGSSFVGMDTGVALHGVIGSCNFDALTSDCDTPVNVGSQTVANARFVPTPATLALFGLGLAGLGWSRRKKV